MFGAKANSEREKNCEKQSNPTMLNNS